MCIAVRVLWIEPNRLFVTSNRLVHCSLVPQRVAKGFVRAATSGRQVYRFLQTGDCLVHVPISPMYCTEILLRKPPIRFDTDCLLQAANSRRQLVLGGKHYREIVQYGG